MDSNSVPHIRVAILDLGIGNLFSVRQACLYAKMDPVITQDIKELQDADAVIMPGVGAFADAMGSLKRLELISLVRDWIAAEKPFMGICLGMQLLMEYSEEFGMHEGLGIFSGGVKRFEFQQTSECTIRVPEMGWNRIYSPAEKRWDETLLSGLAHNAFMYFVHSYYVVPKDQSLICSVTNYGGTEFCSSISRNNLFACQFHPERSGQRGLMIYENFARSCSAYCYGTHIGR